MPKQLPGLSETFLASSTFEQALNAMDVLVVQKMRRLEESLVTLVTLKGPVCRILVCATVAYKRILLLETHLALLTLEGPVLGVGALVLPEV